MILNRLNSINLPNIYSFLIEKENFNFDNKVFEGGKINEVFKQLSYFFFDSGMNSLSLFRKIKNNKLECSEMSRENFYSTINDKYAFFKLKGKSIKNFNSEQIMNMEEKISFFMLEDILSHNPSLIRRKEEITYKNDNLQIIHKIFNKTNEIGNETTSNQNVIINLLNFKGIYSS